MVRHVKLKSHTQAYHFSSANCVDRDGLISTRSIEEHMQLTTPPVRNARIIRGQRATTKGCFNWKIVYLSRLSTCRHPDFVRVIGLFLRR